MVDTRPRGPRGSTSSRLSLAHKLGAHPIVVLTLVSLRLWDPQHRSKVTVVNTERQVLRGADEGISDWQLKATDTCYHFATNLSEPSMIHHDPRRQSWSLSV